MKSSANPSPTIIYLVRASFVNMAAKQNSRTVSSIVRALLQIVEVDMFVFVVCDILCIDVCLFRVVGGCEASHSV